MGDVCFRAPERAVLDPSGRRLWAHVLRFEPGRAWLVPAEPSGLTFGDSVEVSFFAAEGPPMRMCAVVTWLGREALAVDVQHAADRDFTRQWAASGVAAVSRRRAA